MNNFEKSNSPWRMWAQKHWWLLIFAGVSYLGGLIAPYLFIPWGDIEIVKTIANIFYRMGETVIVGGLISFFSSYRYIIKGYRDELNEVLYGKEYLKRRNDIQDVWNRVSKVILNERFIPIQDKILDIIRKTYFIVDGCYYQNYKTTIVIKWDKINSNYIEVMETIEFDLIAGSDQKFPFNQKYSVKTKSKSDDYCYVHMSIKINDQASIEEDGVYDDTIHGLLINRNISLEGHPRYHILKIVKRRYSIIYDNYICFRATYMTNNMDIYISHPSDMCLSIVEKGTQNDFSSNIIHEECCIFKYNGLILPRQGYVILISRIN